MTNKNILTTISMLPLYWAFIASFLYAGLGDYIETALAVPTLIFIFIAIKNKEINVSSLKEKASSPLIIFLTVGLLISIFFKLYHGYGSSQLRIFAYLFLYFLFAPSSLYSTFRKHYFPFLVLSSITVFIFPLYHSIILSNGRGWPINALPYTTFAVIVASIVLYEILFNSTKFITLKNTILSVGFLLATFGIFLGASRTNIAAFLFVLVCMLIVRFWNNKKNLAYAALVVAVIFVGMGSKYISFMYEKTANEVHSLLNGETRNSTGYRLEMWYSVTQMPGQPYWLGIGNKAVEYKKELYEKGIITGGAHASYHFHNQYLDSYAKTGILGLSFFFFVLLYPLIKIKSKKVLLVTFILATSALTDTVMLCNELQMAYLLIICLLFLEKEQLKLEGPIDKHQSK